MTTYLVDGADIGSIADAIRSKGGTTASLAFPSAFVSAIEAIPTGGEITSHVGDAAATTVASSAYQSSWYITEASFPMATTIGANAFRGCKALSTVYYATNANIGMDAFNGCTALLMMSLAMKSIGADAFSGCHALSTVRLSTTASIGARAFAECTNLSQVIGMGSASTIIGVNAFSGCRRLGSTFTISANRISGTAFMSCWGLRSVTLYMGGTSPSVAGGAFSSCYNLSYLKISCSSVPGGVSTMFANTPLSVSTLTGAFGSIYVPSSLYTKFRSAVGWSQYSARMKSY